MPVNAATVFESEETETTGTIGDNLTWTLSADGYTLTISGTGEMTGSYSDMTEPEWGRKLRAADVDNDSGITSPDAQYVLVYFLENTVLNEPTGWDEIIPH